MFDFVKELNPANQMLGFLSGPDGVLKNKYIVLDEVTVAPFQPRRLSYDWVGSHYD